MSACGSLALSQSRRSPSRHRFSCFSYFFSRSSSSSSRFRMSRPRFSSASDWLVVTASTALLVNLTGAVTTLTAVRATQPDKVRPATQTSKGWTRIMPVLSPLKPAMARSTSPFVEGLHLLCGRSFLASGLGCLGGLGAWSTGDGAGAHRARLAGGVARDAHVSRASDRCLYTAV